MNVTTSSLRPVLRPALASRLSRAVLATTLSIGTLAGGGAWVASAAGSASAASGAAAASTASTASTAVAATCERTLAAYPYLAPGARGQAVRTLQCLLNDTGYGPVVVDGVYGPQTRAAMSRLEDTFEGPRDAPGTVTNAIWTMLHARSITVTTLKQGMTGTNVTRLQRALRAAGFTVTVDGVFGPQTTAVVKAYQRFTGNTADGVVGPVTGFYLASGASIEWRAF